MKEKRLYLFCLFFLSFGICAQAQWLWDADKLKEIKEHIHTPVYSAAYASLIKDADAKLSLAPFSVTFKEGLAPSGDKHDYVSLSRYVWADPSKPDGLPYIHRDGESNPELNKYDRNPLGNMSAAVTTLSLAYFYSGNEAYAQKAVEFLRVWFLNKDTRMNPHLEYAQFIPGVNNNKGRSFGLIDTYSFVDMLNGICLLENSPAYTDADKKGLQDWFKLFSEWWKTSDQGIAERNGKNNHGLAYDVQLVLFSLFSGDKDTALSVINEFPAMRLFTQIEPDGTQPEELKRTLAFHYSEYNIKHMIDMFAIAKSLGIALYNIESKDGRNFYKAVDFLTPYLGKEVTAWPYQQISGWENAQQNFCEDLYRIVALDPSRGSYLILYQKNSKQNKSARNRLLFGAMEESSN